MTHLNLGKLKNIEVTVNVPETSNDFADQYAKAQTELFHKLLTDLLGHSPTVEEGRECSIVTKKDCNWAFGIKYNHIALGTVTIYSSSSYDVSLKFVPGKIQFSRNPNKLN